MINQQKENAIWQHDKAWPFFKKSIKHIIRLKKLDKHFSFEHRSATAKVPTALLDAMQSYN
jgi:uncharacterized protein (UPF0335 family)